MPDTSDPLDSMSLEQLEKLTAPDPKPGDTPPAAPPADDPKKDKKEEPASSGEEKPTKKEEVAADEPAKLAEEPAADPEPDGVEPEPEKVEQEPVATVDTASAALTLQAASQKKAALADELKKVADSIEAMEKELDGEDADTFKLSAKINAATSRHLRLSNQLAEAREEEQAATNSYQQAQKAHVDSYWQDFGRKNAQIAKTPSEAAKVAKGMWDEEIRKADAENKGESPDFIRGLAKASFMNRIKIMKGKANQAAATPPTPTKTKPSGKGQIVPSSVRSSAPPPPPSSDDLYESLEKTVSLDGLP